MKKLALTLLILPAFWLSATAQTLPTADEVINKYIAAIGGKKALMNVKDVTSLLSLQVNNTPYQLTTKQKAPAKSLQITTNDNGQLVYKSVTDGTSMVGVSSQGTTPVTGLIANRSIMAYKLFPELSYKQEGIKSTVEGKEQVDGRDAYKVTSTFADGTPLWTDYYDVETGLKVKNIGVFGQDDTRTSKYSEYKDVNGVKFPFSVNIVSPSMTISLKTNSVQINKGISDAEFNVQ
ncbi:hypothetical protein BN8_06434 [Fibrisoma limi BUZ 3]|uniref:Uncharacterized protein n=1 Tax=Fibrisoma limi BUZ 3 TaxID=1185876 RepID=I2GT06_9BACT|nr:hypothetical protein [Fibrisoma limi]CCH57035.1 hypothetical protein BN8_06434 [Fibrisoma limi BUZ 3]